MRFQISAVLAVMAASKVQHEKTRQTFVKTPFEKYDPDVKTIVYKNKSFSSKLSEIQKFGKTEKLALKDAKSSL